MVKFYLFFTLLLFSFSFGQVKKQTVKIKKIETTKTDILEITERKIDLTNDPELLNNTIVETIPRDTFNDENTVYNVATLEIKPEFPGGINELFTFFAKNFQISIEMKENQVKGRIYASFVVEKKGTITDIKIIRDLGFDSAKETIRVLKMMPKWKPGSKNGKAVNCSFTIPISIDATTI